MHVGLRRMPVTRYRHTSAHVPAGMAGRGTLGTDVLIRIQIERTQPLAGTAATEGAEPLRFDGWLELLRVVAELVAAAAWGGEDADAAAEPIQGNQGDDTRHPESPAHD